MADELQEKKPKPIGTPAPNVPKPKKEPAPAPKQQLLPKSENSKVGNVKVKPGSPFKSESVPVGVQQKPLESQNHVEKRVDKMFKDTNQPTLGVWNKNNTHPMSDPDSIRFNPNLKYKPTKEQLEAANRKRIMSAGFAPKSSEERSKLLSPTDSRQFSSDELNKIGSTNVGFDKNKSYAYDVVKAGDKYHVKGYRNTENNWPSEDDMEDIEFKDANGNPIDGFNSFDEALEAMNKGGYPVYDNLKGQEKKETPNPFKQNPMPGFEGMDNLWDNMSKSGQKVIDNNKNPAPAPAPAPAPKQKFDVNLDGDHLGEIEADTPEEAERLAQQRWPGHPDDDILSVEEQMPETEQRAKASELYGTDLNNNSEPTKSQLPQGYEHLNDVNNKERKYVLNGMKNWFGLDTEDWHNADDYLPEQGFDGDLMLQAYAQADEENGFDNMTPEEEVWEAVEGKYNELFEQKYPNGMPKDDEEEQPQQPIWDKNNEPGSATTTKELEEYVREQMKKDGGLNDNFIDAYVSNLHKDSKQADFWKQRMKDDFNKKGGK